MVCSIRSKFLTNLNEEALERRRRRGGYCLANNNFKISENEEKEKES
jgi:hypothetical protein